MKRNNKKKNRQKRNFINLIILLVIILVITLCLNFFINLNKPIYTKKFPVFFQINNEYGLTINYTKLDFGMVIPGATVDKFVMLENHYTFPVKVEVIVSEEVKDFIYGTGYFYIKAGEEHKYGVSLVTEQDSPYGNYSGEILFNFYPAE